MIEKFKERKIGLTPDDCSEKDVYRLDEIFEANNIHVFPTYDNKSTLEWLLETILIEKWDVILFENGNLDAYRNDSAELFKDKHPVITIRDFIDAVDPDVVPININDDEFMEILCTK